MTKKSTKSKKEELKFGSDPEYFAASKKGKYLYVLPPVVLQTDYNAPFEENDRHPIFARYGDTVVHADGAAFEMSTPPSTDWRTMWNTLNSARIMFEKDVLSKYSEVCDGKLYSVPSIRYDVHRWEDRGEEFKMATEFGCDADQDIYDLEARCKVIDASKHPWRYGGGHIHMSGISQIKEYPLIAIRSAVITAGVASTAYTDVPDLEKKRLYLYGRPGKFRFQHYPNGEFGIEYRTPSNTWTKDINIADKIFTWAKIGMESLLRGGLFSELAPIVEADAIDCIRNVDQKAALDILNFLQTKI